MHFRIFHIAEKPDQHIKKMNPDIGGNPAGFFMIPFPGGKIPVPPGGDIGKIHHVFPGFAFKLGQGIHVPGAQDQRLFTDGMGADPQGKPDMGIMKIVRRADADIMNSLILRNNVNAPKPDPVIRVSGPGR